VPPVATCQNITVQLDNTGNGSTTASAVNNGSSDNCAIASLSLSQTAFVCSEVGANTEVLTVTDVNGNSSTCSTTITVQDNVAPVAICQNITVQLNNTGTATITPAQVDNGSSDACGIASPSLDNTSFTCANVNGNTVILTVTDVNANSSTCSATVTILDTVPPVATCQNITVQLDNTGNGSTTASAVNNGSSDNCAIATLSLSQTAFVCSEVGANTEVLTVTDVNGNSSTCTTTITVQDNVAPVAICQNITVQLNNTGTATITPAQVDNGSSDACGIASLALDNASFTCGNVNGNAVILTVTDMNGNSSTCSANVTIVDTVPPVATCQDITVQLDNTGNGSTTASAVNNGSSDNCAIASFSLSQTAFVCSEVGANTEVLTVTDVNGNSSTCTTTITVQDNVAPVAICQNITVQLNNTGTATITPAQVNNGSSDACGIASLALDNTSFTCANVNGNTVILTVTDVNANSSTCSATVTILDTVPPVATCQNITVQLDNTGNGSTTASAVNNGSSDNCAIASLSLSQTAFVCSEVGANTEVLTVTDVNGNSSTCTTTITVQDNVAPVAICQNITVQLNNTGTATITPAQVNNGSSDACGIASLSLDNTSFTCANVNGNTVILTVTGY
jgi:large repetitive protein